MDITMDQREAYSEVLEVLRHMEKKYVDKIPKKIIMFFYDNCRLDYEFTMTESLEKTNFKSKTIDLLSLLNANYWQKSVSKDDIIMNYGIESKLNSQLEQNNKFTKIDTSNSIHPVVISSPMETIKSVFRFIADIFIKIFGD